MSLYSPLDMSALVKDFEAYLRDERMRSPSTIKRYLSIVTDFAAFMTSEPGYEVLDLDRVEKNHLLEFLRREAGASAEPSRAIWNLRLASLRSFYDFLFKREVVSVNPAHKIDRLKVNPKEPVPLSLDEFLALVDAMETAGGTYRARNVAIAHVLFHCALRVAELVSLEVHQADLSNHVFPDVPTKGAKWLSVPFNDLVASVLERYLSDRPQLARGEASALFLSDRGKRLSIRAVQEMLTTYGLKARIGRTVTPHLLRHSSATELVELGTSMRTVQAHCGHASITTTERYVHVKDGARRKAIDALGRRVTRVAAERASRKIRAKSA